MDEDSDERVGEDRDSINTGKSMPMDLDSKIQKVQGREQGLDGDEEERGPGTHRQEEEETRLRGEFCHASRGRGNGLVAANGGRLDNEMSNHSEEASGNNQAKGGTERITEAEGPPEDDRHMEEAKSNVSRTKDISLPSMESPVIAQESVRGSAGEDEDPGDEG